MKTGDKVRVCDSRSSLTIRSGELISSYFEKCLPEYALNAPNFTTRDPAVEIVAMKLKLPKENDTIVYDRSRNRLFFVREKWLRYADPKDKKRKELQAELKKAEAIIAEVNEKLNNL